MYREVEPITILLNIVLKVLYDICFMIDFIILILASDNALLYFDLNS